MLLNLQLYSYYRYRVLGALHFFRDHLFRRTSANGCFRNKVHESVQIVRGFTYVFFEIC